MEFLKAAGFSLGMTLIGLAVINRVSFLRKLAGTDPSAAVPAAAP